MQEDGLLCAMAHLQQLRPCMNTTSRSHYQHPVTHCQQSPHSWLRAGAAAVDGSQEGWDGENGILSNKGSTDRPVFSFPLSLEITLLTVWP